MARVYYSIEICVSIPVHVVLLMATRVVAEQLPVTSPRLDGRYFPATSAIMANAHNKLAVTCFGFVTFSYDSLTRMC